MRDFRDAKAMAQTLRATLAAMGFKITVSQSLELIAKAFGLPDWNTLSAAIRAEPTDASGNTSRQPPASQSAKTPDKSPTSHLSGQLESTLNQAFAYAKGRKHEEITVEHLLRFLLEDADASPVMKACGVDLGELRQKLTDYIEHEVKIQPTDHGANPKPTAPTVEFQRVLQRAFFHVQAAGRLPVTSLNVLVAMFSEKETRAVKLLNEKGVTRIDVINFITHGLAKGGGAADSAPPT